MNNLFSGLVVILTVLFTFSAFSQPNIPVEIISSTRQQMCLNGLWNFMPASETNELEPGTTWGSIWVPGAWFQDAWWTSCPGIEQAGKGKIWETSLADVSKAWYQKKVVIPVTWKNSSVILDLGRVSTDAMVYVDGIKAGNIMWPGGELDVTKYVHTGNTCELKILVLASASQKEVFELMGTAIAQVKLKPASLSSKGITGEVFLKSRPTKTYISDVFLQTSVRKKNLKAEIEITGITKSETLLVKASLCNENGNQEKQFSGTIQVVPSKKQVQTISWIWENPRLWDLDQPNLYSLKLSVKSNQINDEYAQEFGFREFWSEGKDFYLNNKKINLRPTSNTPGSGNYELTDAAISGLRKSGYNFLEIWPQDISERGMLQFNDIFANRADHKGALISAPLPSSTPYIMNTNWQFQWNEPGKKQEWEAKMFEELKRIRNHPSIVMWGLNANFFGHSDDQNPLVIGQRGWIKEDSGWQTNEVAGNETVTIIKKYDPTRLVFNHHGAFTGDVHTLNFYLCLTPLQERIEWLSHYARFGNMPFMAIEFGTPLENTMLRGRCPFGESIVTEPFFTEYAAIYQGRKAYETETQEYRNEIRKHFLYGQKYQKWQNSLVTNTLSSFQQIQKLFNTETWQAWRTWGISGGMVPWSEAHGWRRKAAASEMVWMPAQKPGQRGTYLKNVSKGDQNFFDEKYWDILPSAKALIINNNETLAWIAGSPEKFTEKSHSFKAGQIVTKQIVLINDSREVLSFHYKTTVLLNRKVISEKSESGRIGFAENLKNPLNFTLPTQLPLTKTDGQIILKANIGNYIHHDTLNFRAFETIQIKPLKISCFDPMQKTSQMLRQMGWETMEWTGDLSVPFMVIGREALSEDCQLPGSLKDYVASGGRLLIMTQKPEWFENIGFRIARHLPRQIFAVNKNHAVLAGLDDTDLCNWNGQSTLIEAYPDYLNRSTKEGMYGVPYYGWHWGNQGALSGAMLEKPHQSSWTPILEGEFDLAYSPLMEMNYRNGTVILCTLDLEDYFRSDPAAEKITNQLLQYACQKLVNQEVNSVVYLGDEAGKKQLEKMGLLFSVEKRLNPLSGILIIGQNAQVSDADLRKYLETGGRVLFLNRGNESGPLSVSFRKKENFSGSLNIPEWSETSGISISDLHLRTGKVSWLVGNDCEIGADGMLGKLKIGKGTALFCQFDPNGLNADSLTFFRQTRWRQTRALAQILANMGACFKSDELIFTSISNSSDINLEGKWKARLIEKLPVTLSVVGGNEDHGVSSAAKKLLDFKADEQYMQTVHVPMAMERYGSEWSEANGEAVFRKTIEISEDFAGKDLELDLGVIDDFDETYFNGKLVGKINASYEEYWGYERKYRIPSLLIKPCKNVISVRVFDRYGSGGLVGSEKPMVLKIAAGNANPGFYHADYRTDFKLGDDPYRYFRW